MNAIQQFNGLNGQTNISRQTLQELVEQAKKENATVIIYRISKILNDFPDEEHFDISLKQYPEPSHGLNGAIHTGSYEEALDECGRLRKGWFFKNGYIYQIKDNKKIRHEKGGRLDIKNSNKKEKEEKKKNSHSAENKEDKGKKTEKEKEEEKEKEDKVIHIEDLDLSNFIKQPKIAYFDKKGEHLKDDFYYRSWAKNTFMQKGITAPIKKILGNSWL